MRRKIASCIASFLGLLPVTVLSQISDAQRKYTAYDMRSNGKIYVVVTVILIILIGLLLYLLKLDRKITKLEKDNR